jgi:hypothetical protein
MRAAFVGGLSALSIILSRAAVSFARDIYASAALNIEGQNHTQPHTSRSPSTGKLVLDPADDILWNRCVCKGAQLLAGMQMTDREAGQRFYNPPQESAQSRWNRWYEMGDWGYNSYDVPDTPRADFTVGPNDGTGEDHGWDIDHALRMWGLSDKVRQQGGKFDAFQVFHGDPAKHFGEEDGVTFDEQTYKKDGRTFRVSSS